MAAYDETIIPSCLHFSMQNIEQSCGLGRARADPEGGTGVQTPPGKSQVIWVSIENKQLNPPPEKSWTPLENVGPPLEP